MELADLRSQMAQDINDIKAHLEVANRHPEKFAELDAELQTFMAKYGTVPELEQATAPVGEIAQAVHERSQAIYAATHQQPTPSLVYSSGTGAASTSSAAGGYAANAHGVGKGSAPPQPNEGASFAQETIDGWLEQLTGTLDACGTSDDLNMIYIKQLNDRINNSSGMVSGIIESRSNATASIINNIA
jgi:hypothetical protein